VDGFDRRVAVACFRALSRGALLALVALLALGLALPAGPREPLLASGLATLSLLSLLWARLLRGRRLRLHGPGMVAAVLLLGAATVLCMVPTGGGRSPLVLVLATVVGVAGLTLSPLGNLVAMSALCLLHSSAALAHPSAPHARDLLVQLGLLGLMGFVVNLLACRLREQRAELFGLAMRDPLTGALRRSFFRARLVALLEDAQRDGRGVSLVLLDLGSGPVEEAGDALRDAVRGDDLVGRVGERTFAVAAAAPGARGPAIAERVAKRMRPIAESRIGLAQLVTVEGDPIALAGRLFSEAEAALEPAGSEPAARSPQLVSSASAP
jgi:GGDEF domain-containing protein